MTTQMVNNQLVLVPIEILRVIPLYNGDKSKLNLFLRKCEYVIDMYKGNEAQNLYLLHTVTSRLVDNAADLLSEREDIKTWSQLKELLLENYSDSRSEDSIAVEFESLQIKPHQSLLTFYNLLQATYKTLMSKIDTQDELIKSKKVALYNKMAINALMYNLPLCLVQILRLKSPNSLEEAYGIVLDEISFFKLYNKKHTYSNLATVPELKCFYQFGVATPLFPQPSCGLRGGFGLQPVPFQFANQKSFGSDCFGSTQSQQKSSLFTSTSFGAPASSTRFGAPASSKSFGAPASSTGFGAPATSESFIAQTAFKAPVNSEQNGSNVFRLPAADNVENSVKSNIHAFHDVDE